MLARTLQPITSYACSATVFQGTPVGAPTVSGSGTLAGVAALPFTSGTRRPRQEGARSSAVRAWDHGPALGTDGRRSRTPASPLLSMPAPGRSGPDWALPPLCPSSPATSWPARYVGSGKLGLSIFGPGAPPLLWPGHSRGTATLRWLLAVSATHSCSGIARELCLPTSSTSWLTSTPPPLVSLQGRRTWWGDFSRRRSPGSSPGRRPTMPREATRLTTATLLMTTPCRRPTQKTSGYVDGWRVPLVTPPSSARSAALPGPPQRAGLIGQVAKTESCW